MPPHIIDLNLSAIQNKVLEIENALTSYKGNNLGVYDGTMGFPLFYSKLFELTDDEQYLTKCHHWVEFTIDKLADADINHTFCGGLAGIGWVIDFLRKKKFLEFDADSFFEDMENHIYPASITDLRMGHYDFLHGGLGPALFALRRLPADRSFSYLKDVVYYLGKAKRADSSGIKWLDLINTKPNEDHYNLSLSHGMASIINILTRIRQKNIQVEETEWLIEQAINYILGHKLPSSISIFPSKVVDNITTTEAYSRLAWCYGDFGIAWTLWIAGTVCKRPTWRDEALIIVESLVKRIEPSLNPNTDAGFCHGTAGIAYLFKRMFHATKVKACEDKYYFWIKETMRHGSGVNGLAGYQFHHTSGSARIDIHNMLEGICGVGMVLIDYLKNETADPDWDECFLISL